MSTSFANGRALLRAEMAQEVDSGFTRLRRIPETDIIWFLDYFPGLTGADQNALLDELADSAALAFGPPTMPKLNEKGTIDAPPAIARMCKMRERPGGKGGTRYTDIKMLRADPLMRQPDHYHSSWREHMTPLHFQPRSDLLPSLENLKPAKAPLLRKLVNTALTNSPALKVEKQPGGVSKFTGRIGDSDLKVWVDFGGQMSQLGYSMSLKNAAGEPLLILLNYERLWAAQGRWDYITEENAPRSVEFFADQVAYLANLGERVHACL